MCVSNAVHGQEVLGCVRVNRWHDHASKCPSIDGTHMLCKRRDTSRCHGGGGGGGGGARRLRCLQSKATPLPNVSPCIQCHPLHRGSVHIYVQGVVHTCGATACACAQSGRHRSRRGLVGTAGWRPQHKRARGTRPAARGTTPAHGGHVQESCTHVEMARVVFFCFWLTLQRKTRARVSDSSTPADPLA